MEIVRGLIILIITWAAPLLRICLILGVWIFLYWKTGDKFSNSFYNYLIFFLGLYICIEILSIPGLLTTLIQQLPRKIKDELNELL